MGTDPGAIAGIVIYVKDVERAAHFYQGVLRVAAVEREPDFVVLSGPADGDLILVRIPSALADGISITAPPELREETPVKPSFLVASLADAAAAATSHGGGTKPVEAAWTFRGMRHLDAFDPEGNVVQFVERVAAHDRTHPQTP